MFFQPEISVIIPTYNRSELVRDAVLSVLRQDAREIVFEIIVVDNNSSDDTEAVIKSLIAGNEGNLQYVVERQQGNAYARNAGIAKAQGSLIAFIDDDVVVEGNWLGLLNATFQGRGDLSFVGGRVLPRWNYPLPSWLTRKHWSPLALIDYGEEEFLISGQNPIGLLTANIAFRRNVFDELGVFSPELQRVKNGIGSLEDHEFLMRVCRSGKKGLYVPRLVAVAPVDLSRLTKDYHRRWHSGHGQFYAILSDPEWERSHFRFMGVPGHLYRETATHAVSWFSRMMRGTPDAAFEHECKLRFFGGFFVERLRNRRRTGGAFLRKS